jgi:hypothetical protein
VYSEDQSYQSNGAVGANGVVRVSVAGAGQSASGSGRLSGNSGAGRWRSSRGECSGGQPHDANHISDSRGTLWPLP